MKSFTWLKSLCPRPTRRARRPIRHTSRLRLEVLEDRTVPAMFLVTSSLDDGSAGTLRDAVTQANSTPGADAIAFAPGLNGVITLTGGELDIGDDLTIVGPGAAQLAVSGNHASRVFEINSGVTASLSGLTIENGIGAHSY